MNPSKQKYYRTLFAISAAYDLLLGIAFAFFGARTFGILGIADRLPAFTGYITLPGAFVIVIGIACALIARGDLTKNADLILICALYKLAYAVTVFYYWAVGTLPHAAFGAFAVADALFFVLMIESFVCASKAGHQRPTIPGN